MELHTIIGYIYKSIIIPDIRLIPLDHVTYTSIIVVFLLFQSFTFQLVLFVKKICTKTLKLISHRSIRAKKIVAHNAWMYL